MNMIMTTKQTCVYKVTITSNKDEMSTTEREENIKDCVLDALGHPDEVSIEAQCLSESNKPY